jgi:hypothetical protein
MQIEICFFLDEREIIVFYYSHVSLNVSEEKPFSYVLTSILPLCR